MRNLIIAVAAVAATLQQAIAPVVTQQIANLSAQPAEAASATTPSQYALKINMQPDGAIDVVSTRGNFDREVLTPLRAAQEAKARAEAEAAAKAAAEAQARAAAATQVRASSTPAVVVGVATGDVWEKLRQCESGGNYANKKNPKYRGAYQYDYSTWANYGGFYDPADAPPAVQDAKARETQARRGWSPWPACARKLGLL